MKLLDLKSAFLQLHVAKELWKFQLVRYNLFPLGKTWALTRQRFGLNCAPRIMSKILGYILSTDARIERGTDQIDSATVAWWLRATLPDDGRVKGGGAGEMLVKRRLTVFSELVREYDLNISVKFVRSELNKADALTRVKSKWLQISKDGLAPSYPVEGKESENCICNIILEWTGPYT